MSAPLQPGWVHSCKITVARCCTRPRSTRNSDAAGTIRRTTRKEGFRNRRRLSSTFAFAAVPASFAVSVGLPMLSKGGLRAKTS